MNTATELVTVLADYDSVIAYEPLTDEPDWRSAPLPAHLKETARLLTQDKDDDPFAVAEECIRTYAGKKVCVLIPGQQFDHGGARHGRGGGWYDRFLSRTPEHWLRIGVAHEHQVSAVLLKTQLWDKAVSLLLIEQGGQWKLPPLRGR